MITACDTQDFIPFGREYIRQHPGQFQIQRTGGSPTTDYGIPLVKSFKEISLQESVKKESWLFRKHDGDGSSKDSVFDEELYVRGASVVWSRGSQDGVRTVVKTFTMDTPVLQALWGSFVLSANEHSVDSRSEMGATGKKEQGICVLESSTLTFFREDGGEYSTPLPFQVSRTWVIKNGLLFERALSHAEVGSQKKNCPSQTVIFSMLHPLDDVAPAITRSSVSGGPPKISYLTDSSMVFIYTSSAPSLAFTYDSALGHHSVWSVRKARQEEINQLAGSLDNTSFLHTASHALGAGAGLSFSSSSSRHLANVSGTGAGNTPSFSPLRSISGRVMSPAGILRSSPGISAFTSGRAQSPGISTSTNSALYRFHTPPMQTCSQGRFLLSPGSAPSGASFLANESLLLDPLASLQPSVCLEHLWQETAHPVRDGALGKASKAFLSRDLCGQQYFCYMVPYKQHLRCLKFEESNDRSQLIFGSVTYLHAKDATPIESQDMLLVLEITGVLVLYSGITKISQVHIPVMPLGSGSISLARSAMTPFGSPVKGDIFTSSRPPSAMDIRFDDELSHISPVTAHLEELSGQLDGSAGVGMVTPGNSFIQNLRDNVGKKFSVELLNGSFCRTELPPMTSSPGIDLCLKALKHLLPSDRALQLLACWYTTRSTPGGVGNVSEWSMFTKCILGLMGYDVSKLRLTNKGVRDGSFSPVLRSKKARPSDQGSDEDWEYILNSEHHQHASQSHRVLGITSCSSTADQSAPGRPCGVNQSALLFTFSPSVLLGLHLVYEEMKLNVLLQEEVLSLAPLVHQLASDLKCESFADGYRRDLPHLFNDIDELSPITQGDLEKMHYPQIFPSEAPTVLGWITQAVTTDKDPKPMPFIPGVCENIRKVISVYAVLVSEEHLTDTSVDKYLKKIAPAGHRAPTADSSLSFSVSKSMPVLPSNSRSERMVLAMVELGLTQHALQCIPIGISLPMREACLLCRSQPPSDWLQEAYVLIGRQDLSELASLTDNLPSCQQTLSVSREKEDADKENEDGMEYLDEEVLKLRFPKDLRVQEVRRLLQSARPVTIALKQRPEVSDHDFIEEQEKSLLATCVRTMALPVGRGIFTLQTCQPLLTETLPIAKLCLTGRAPPRNTTVDLTRIDVPNNMSVWPQFHNGVAAGLRIADSTQVDSAWIIYNKPKELTNEFAGFLMALGLNGHLPNLCTFNIHEYLSEGSELVSVAILLGMSAAKRGSMDPTVTKALSVHVSALLPPTSMELNIAHNTRVAAIMGVGLLYQGTGHLHMAEVMLSEIGRPPGPEMENCVDRDSYALSAGLSLGLIMFGKGNQMTGLSDLSIADLLCHMMVGGHTKQMLWPNRDRVYKAPSFLIKEGDRVNVDVTASGATLALGMMFFNTNNSAVSERLKAPDTQFMLEQVRPDFLCLRTISYGLVNWETVLPTCAWISSNIPEIVQKYAFYKPPSEDNDLDSSIDLQTMSQAHCNITSGACMVMALKFAGSANREAFKTLLNSLGSSVKLLRDQALLDQAGRSTVENCISVKLLALAIVMAGTGDLVTLRICRALRRRVGPQYHQFTYGNHMCTAMATGLLFLGGGKFTLKTTPDAIGAMLCAFYPQFPQSSTDNKYHLQAFRHLYVLACEPRIIIPKDVDTGKFCFVPLRIKFKGCSAYKSVSFNAGAPYIIPELSKLEEIQVLGTRYWPISFREDKNWDTLRLLLHKGGVLGVKQRAGHLSYMEDPKGYRSTLAKSLMADSSCHFVCQPDLIKSFTSDACITGLAEYFIKYHKSDNAVIQELFSLIYQCVSQEKAEAICPHFILKHISQQFSHSCTTLGIQQLRLVMDYYLSRHRLQVAGTDKDRLVYTEFLLSLRCQIEQLLDNWVAENLDSVGHYLHHGQPLSHSTDSCLSQYLVWFAFPNRMQLWDKGHQVCPPIPILAKMFPRLHMAGLIRLHQLLNSVL